MNVGPRASAPIRRASSSASSFGSEPVSRPSTAKRERWNRTRGTLRQQAHPCLPARLSAGPRPARRTWSEPPGPINRNGQCRSGSGSELASAVRG